MELIKQSDLKQVATRMEDLGLTPEQVAKECSFAIQLINKSKQLKGASLESKQSAILNVAQTGLTLNPIQKLAYLVPRWQDGGMQVCLEPSYQGLVKLLTDTGSVKTIQAQLVYENDEFSADMANFDNPIIHKPDPFKDRGQVIGVYAIALLPNGAKQAETMGLQELREVRERSESYKAFKAGKIKSCVWETDQGEMMRKTVLRRFVKYLPKTDQFSKVANAIALDETDYKASDNAKEFAYNLLETANLNERMEVFAMEQRIKFATSSEISTIIEELKELQIDNGRKSQTAINQELKERIL